MPKAHLWGLFFRLSETQLPLVKIFIISILDCLQYIRSAGVIEIDNQKNTHSTFPQKLSSKDTLYYKEGGTV